MSRLLVGHFMNIFVVCTRILIYVRSVCTNSFSADGEYLYTIQCMRRGETMLAKWELIPYLSEDEPLPAATESSAAADTGKKGKKLATKKVAREPSFLIDVIPAE
jgi:hypothetical protein